MSSSAHYNLPPIADTAPPTSGAPGPSISDVTLFHTADGGEISFQNGLPLMSDGLASAAYLSLFGGNADDSGLRGDVSKQWWANFSESNPSRQYRSETQFLLSTLPPTTGNMRRLESAASNDLAWFVADGLAQAVSAAASMPAINRVKLIVIFVIDGRDIQVDFERPWGPNT